MLASTFRGVVPSKRVHTVETASLVDAVLAFSVFHHVLHFRVPLPHVAFLPCCAILLCGAGGVLGFGSTGLRRTSHPIFGERVS